MEDERTREMVAITMTLAKVLMMMVMRRVFVVATVLYLYLPAS